MKPSTMQVFLVVIAGMAFVLPSQTGARFCNGPRDQLVAEGDNATFSCYCRFSRGSFNPYFRYIFDDLVWQWVYQVFPEQPIVVSSYDHVNEQFADKFSVASSRSSNYLYISNVSTIESGQYFCRVYLQDQDNFYLTSPVARLSISKEAGNQTILRLRSPPQCEDISPRKEEHQAGDQITLTCTPPVDSEGMVRAISWSLPGNSSVFGGMQYLTPRQHHSYTVTKILRNEDNCKRFRCDASPPGMFENLDDARCSVVPLKIPVSVSPMLAFAAVGGRAKFDCSSEGETVLSRFVWRKQPKNTGERSEINGTDGRFQVDASGKTLTVSPVLAEDDGTKIMCQVWYQMDCRKPSPWSTLKVLGPEKTPSQRGTETTPSDDYQPPLQAPGVGTQDVAGAAVGCFLAGVVVTSLVALAVKRKTRKTSAPPAPRNAAAPGSLKSVRYTPAGGLGMHRPKDDNSSCMVYENVGSAPTRIQVDDDVYEIPNTKPIYMYVDDDVYEMPNTEPQSEF